MIFKRKSFLSLLIIVLTLCVNLCACSLIPKEDEPLKITIKKTDHSEDYLLTKAKYKDVIKSKTLICTYLQLNKEDLSFPLEGERIDCVYVKIGDTVKAGDLLAKLDSSAYEDELVILNDEIEKLELLVRQQDELIDYYQTKIDKGNLGMYQKAECMDNLISCKQTKSNYSDELEYSKLRHDDFTKKIEDGKLYASIDGKVSYVRGDLATSKSKIGTTVITILDTSVCAFQAEDKEAAAYLEEGEAIDIVMSTGVVLSSTVESVELETGKIMFELDEPDYSLSVGTRANAEVIFEKKENCLTLPALSIYNAEDEYYVYCLNDEGIREMNKVEVGLFGNKDVEILSGIDETKSVIVR